MIQAKMPRGLRSLVLTSLVAHGVLAAALVLASQSWAFGRRPTQTVLMTKLVRLGTPRAPNLLPRLTAPAAKPLVALPGLTPAKPAAAHSTSSETSARERLAEMNQVSRALDHLKKEAMTAGDASGTPDGEVSDLAHSIVGDRYATEVRNSLHSNWDIYQLDPQRAAGHQATVVVYIEADGHLVNSSIEKSSGLEWFDQSVLRAIKKCNKVSPPPREIADQVRRYGYEVDFDPSQH